MIRRYEVDTIVTVAKSDPVKRGWKNEKGESEFELYPPEWHVRAGTPLFITFVLTNEPPFQSVSRAKLILEVDDGKSTGGPTPPDDKEDEPSPRGGPGGGNPPLRVVEVVKAE